jgi:hypothetical protein
MSDKARMALIVLVLVVVGAAIWNLQFLSSPDAGPSNEVSPDSEPHELKTRPTPNTAFPADVEKPVDETKVVPAAVSTSASRRGGRGTLAGKISIVGGTEIPPDLVLTLHHIPEDARYVPSVETVYATLEAGGKKEFEFTDLPMGWIVVFGASGTHTGSLSTKIEPQFLDYTRHLVLYPAASISGTVVNEAGEAVPDAHVFVTGYLEDGVDVQSNIYRSRATMVDTDEFGAFRMNNLRVRTSEYRLLALAPGYAPTVTELLPVHATDVQIVMGAGGTVSGTLVNQDTGEPIPDRQLDFTSKFALTGSQQTTGEDGSFRFEEVTGGEYSFSINDDKLIVMPDTAQLDIEFAETIENTIVHVRTGGVVAGRIYDADTGEGIVNAKLYAFPRGIIWAEGKNVVSNATGEFEITGLYDGTYEVRYGAVPGYPSSKMWDDRKQINAAIGQRMIDIDFPMSGGLSVSGRVVDENGKPLKNVRVNGHSQHANSSENVLTKKDGRFAIYGFQDGASVRLSAKKDGLSHVSRRVPLKEESVANIDLVMTNEGTISGIVVNTKGESLKKISLYAVVGNNFSLRDDRQTNAEGEFKFRGLGSGEYEIRLPLAAGAYNPDDKKLEIVTLGVGESVEGIRLVVDRENKALLSIAGHVTNDVGQPVPRANVYGWGSSGGNIQTMTKEDGSYELKNVPEGRYNLNFYQAEHITNSQKFVAGTTNADVVLTRHGAISGRIVDPDHQPVSDFSAMVYQTKYKPTMDNQLKRFHHAEGEFTVTIASPGKDNFVFVRAPGFADKSVAVPGVQPGQTVQNILVRLGPESRVAGVVMDDAGNPIRGAYIYNGPIPRSEYERERDALTTTNADGRFDISGLVNGEIVVAAYKSGYLSASKTIHVSGPETTAQLTLGGGATLTGRITLDGVGVAEIGVNGYMQRDLDDRNQPPGVRSVTNAEGHFTIRGVPVGLGSLSVSIGELGNRRNRSMPYETENGMTTEVNIDFPPANSAIEGYLYISENQPGAGNVHVTIRENGTNVESRSREVGEDGYYLIDGVPPGTLTLQASLRSSRRFSTSTHELGANETLQVDVDLYGGTLVKVRVQNIPEGLTATAAIVPDTHSYHGWKTIQELQTLLKDAVAANELSDGTVEFPGIEQGTYTVVVVAHEPEQTQPDTEVEVISGALQVPDQESTQITLSF